jgi:hypothetical protein
VLFLRHLDRGSVADASIWCTCKNGGVFISEMHRYRASQPPLHCRQTLVNTRSWHYFHALDDAAYIRTKAVLHRSIDSVADRGGNTRVVFVTLHEVGLVDTDCFDMFLCVYANNV